jgi:hypothetical protein
MATIPKSISKNTYNPVTKRESQDKLHANVMYQALIDPEEKHLYLESENLLTTACLRNRGVRQSDLYVVNGNPETCRVISKIVPNVFLEMSTAYLRATSEKFGTLWMDYCCTMEGNVYFRPVEDFEAILSRGIVQNGGVVGFTFSVRQPKKHWRKCSVQKHKLATQEIRDSQKYGFFREKKTMANRKNSRWEHSTIDFCETVLRKVKSRVSCDLEVVNFYRYQHKVGKAPPQMYVFFVRVFYS